MLTESVHYKFGLSCVILWRIDMYIHFQVTYVCVINLGGLIPFINKAPLSGWTHNENKKGFSAFFLFFSDIVSLYSNMFKLHRTWGHQNNGG